MSLEQELDRLRKEVELLRTELLEVRMLVENRLSTTKAEEGEADRLYEFAKRVKELLMITVEDTDEINENGKKRGQRRTLEELANTIGITNSTLSRKLNGKERIHPKYVKQIVKQLLLWGAIESQFAAREMLGLLNVEDLTPAEYREIEEVRGYETITTSSSKSERLREVLSSQDIDAVARSIGFLPTQYQPATVTAFIRERKEYPQLRIIALEAYLHAVQPEHRDANLCKDLLRDYDANIRKFTLQQIRKFNIPIDESSLERVLNDSQQDVVLNAVELAGDLVRAGSIASSILVVPNVAKHRYWRIRRLAIDAIVDADPAYNKIETVTLLNQLQGVTVWSSRKRIVDYLCERFLRGNLSGDDYQLALSIIKKYAADGKSSPEMENRAQKALELLQT